MVELEMIWKGGEVKVKVKLKDQSKHNLWKSIKWKMWTQVK